MNVSSVMPLHKPTLMHFLSLCLSQNLLILINGPVLNTDDKKTIGTRKRYGVAADVIYGVGGVKGAIGNIENPQV